MNFNSYTEIMGLKGVNSHGMHSQSILLGDRRDLQQMINKMQVPLYDDQKMTARAWLH